MKHKFTHNLPTVDGMKIVFETDDYLDTKVSIKGETLCWITWEDRFRFINAFEQVLSKYRI